MHTLELAEALHQLGQDVCVYALNKDGKGFDYPLSCWARLIPTQPASAGTDALIQQRIQEFVDYLNPVADHDIYHAQDCLSANALAILRQQGRVPHMIRTIHHIDEFQSSYLQACQERSIREADLCLCVSDYWQLELQRQYQIDAPRVLNGVNLARFSPQPDGTESALKRRLGLHGSPIFLTIGGVEPRKNSINLLKAFALVRKDFPTAQLVIAGGETLFDYQGYQQEFLALAVQLGISLGDALLLPGVITNADLPALYRLANTFVFPSLKEGWGLVLLEAIASGLPLVTSAQPPFTEFLTPQQAILVDPSSPMVIASALCSSLQPGLAQSLVQQSQAILANYTWSTSAKRHLQHYNQLIGRA